MNTLNDRQYEAVVKTEGPLLVLAGAGSGKTRVITYRIAHLIEEKNVNPWNIMAITFTNKAAGEMRDRIDNMVEFGSEHVWVATFHSTCVRILRRFIDRIGYDNNFTIYDNDDQKTLMKDIFKRLNADPKQLKEKAVLNAISGAKNEMIYPDEFKLNAGSDYVLRRIADIYGIYQEELKKNNALDFDDLLLKTVELFENCPDVLEQYRERFKYIMVDEYQDTNTVQFRFINLLAQKYRNLCVVGDDDQSIYKFRGANIKNILNFEKIYPDAEVIKLEQNYRSTGNILNAANGVISCNIGRKEKKLWTDREDGAKIRYYRFENAYDEAESIARDIISSMNRGGAYKDNACLYRTNQQSRILEEKFINNNIPYKIVGGINFYQRKEIKDMIAYLKTVDNGRDDIAAKRIINVPKRGIGTGSVDKIENYAYSNGMSFFDACGETDAAIGGRSAAKVREFYEFILKFRKMISEECSLKNLIEMIIDETGYVEELKAENTEESLGRADNIDELISKIADYENNTDEPTLSGLLEEIALVADIDSLDSTADYVVLMTIHSAKGLEFPKVYLCGMEDGLFPGYMAISGDGSGEELEEERRLCYVAITRAMRELTLTCAKTRMLRGENQYNRPSRFISEIPKKLIDNRSADRESNIIRERKSETGQYKGTFFRMSDIPKTGNPGSMLNMGNAGNMGKAGNVWNAQKAQKAQKPDYGKGDSVKHVKFGVGKILDITDAGRDYEVTVDFKNYGVKKLFAGFAKLIRLEDAD